MAEVQSNTFESPDLPRTVKMPSTSMAWNMSPEVSTSFRKATSSACKKKKKKKTSSQELCSEETTPKQKKTIMWAPTTDEEPCSPVFEKIANKDLYLSKKDPLSINIAPSDKEDEEEVAIETLQSKWMNFIILFCLILTWIIFTAILMVKGEHGSTAIHPVSVPKDKIRSFWILESPDMKRINVELGGALLPPYYGNLSKHWITLWVELVQINSSVISEKHIIKKKRISHMWTIPIVSESLIDFVPEVKRSTLLEIFKFDQELISESIMRIQIQTNLNKAFPISLVYDLSPIDPTNGILYAAAVLLGLYILIIFEVVHRTLAAIMASTMSIAILAALDERPTTSQLMTWIDVETLILLFSMMVLVAIISDTGIFDYLAVFAFKITNGRIWPLIDTLCAFTAIVSSFLDNVTTALLMTPVTIRLCEVLELNPVPVLMAMIMYSNIGGAITPVGDPPNVIIATNKDIVEAGVSFGVFSLHMGIGLILVMIFVRYQLRFMYRNMSELRFKEPQEVQDLRHEIAIWQRAAGSLSSYSKDEDMVKLTLLKKAKRLLTDLKEKMVAGCSTSQNYGINLEELEKKYPIKNFPLLIKSALTLAFVITLFFLHSVPQLNLSLGWSALLGVILLLILAKAEMENVLARVEWSTLIFFTALFILMGALTRLGLIDWIGHQTEWLILQIDENGRLTIAILLILWVSAIASSFVDNIPLTTMMVRIITSLSQNEELNLPLQPLVWALALGACLGGNGTLIGASANLVCAGVAEQHGYKFSFMQFLKIGFPIMLGSVCVTTVYLLVTHVVIGWNY
ncbi:OCA2 melanosomal transmembrane protein hoepel1 isoform X2 [Rhodnius prolixus]|uniref:OCA2 melanosomal transmembrane protein hoepel1 isoform X2 n=1 Tax=Rhodnius prolixus TaxID=13249 RepID=UPI003D18B77E